MDANQIAAVVLCLTVGVIFALLGMGLIRFRQTAVRIRGRVVGHSGGDGSMPAVEITNELGTRLRVELAHDSSTADFPVGQRFDVLVDPDDPRDVRITSRIPPVWVAFAFLILGIVGVGAGILVWVFRLPVEGPL
jgi:hypothetical protein